MGKVVQSFATGYLRSTIVEDDDGGYLWIRKPGPARDTVMRTPAPAVLSAVLAVSQGQVGLAVPARREDGGVTYRTRQARSLAAMFVAPGGDDVEPIARDTLAAVAAALGRLHAVPPPGDLPGPEGPRRLRSWLRGGGGPGAATELRRRAAEILGRERLAAAEEWCVPAAGPYVLLHGEPGCGILLPVTSGQQGRLLIGEDISAGPPEFDIGWLVGELVEFREMRRGRVDYDGLIDCLLDGYPAALDFAAVSRVAALRFLTHIHDFAAYLGWHEILADCLRDVAEAIDLAVDGRLLMSGAGRR